MIVNILLYTFAIFGIIVFIKDLILNLKNKNHGKLLLLIEDQEDIEEILRSFSKISKEYEEAYILYKGMKQEEERIIEMYIKKNPNIFLISEK